MSRMTIDKARRSTDMFSLRRFGGAGTTKESRHRLGLPSAPRAWAARI